MRFGIAVCAVVAAGALGATGIATGCGGQTASGPGPGDSAALQLVTSGLSSPDFVTTPAGDTTRLFVVEQTGAIRVVRHDSLLPTPFLDLTGHIGFGGERGLLSMAFHPSYASNGRFYVYYTNPAGDIRIVRYTVSANPNVADSTTGDTILSAFHETYDNHNGGLVLFGPDGKLYIGMGDGGSGGDPQNRAQNRDSLLGKLLRIDVDAGDPYAIPPDNPYAGGGGRGEIWAIGLRNPWRYAFDPTSGLLYIADVGQDTQEEVDVAPAAQPGVNYGWRIMEGTSCYNPNPCDQTGLTLPVVAYTHADGCAVIGGFVYRGALSPALAGQYFYADLCNAWVRSFGYANGKVTGVTNWNLTTSLGSVLSFGQDASGEQYVLTGGGSVYRLATP